MAQQGIGPKRVQVRPGQIAIAPRVDDPRGFALHNKYGDSVSVTFSYDPDRHIMTAIIEGPQPAQRLPDQGDLEAGGEHPGPELPA